MSPAWTWRKTYWLKRMAPTGYTVDDYMATLDSLNVANGPCGTCVPPTPPLHGFIFENGQVKPRLSMSEKLGIYHQDPEHLGATRFVDEAFGGASNVVRMLAANGFLR